MKTNDEMFSRHDIVIFGATGFTGKTTIIEVVKHSRTHGRNYTWAVAGRSEFKLRAVLQEVGDKIGKDLSKIPLIIADVSDEHSIEEMTKQARVIINTCGPYQIFGEPVVKFCIKNGCHHVDISAEPYYLEDMQYKYHKQAQENGVYIIGACGILSAASDLGLMFLRSKFDGTLNTVETYFSIWEMDATCTAPLLHTGTWNSAVNGIVGCRKLRNLRAKLFPNKLPQRAPKVPLRGPIHICSFDNKYALPFLGPDKGVMERSERYLHEEEHLRPIQVRTFVCVNSCLGVVKMAVYSGAFLALSKLQCGRNLLLRHPRFFSNGFVAPKGPSDVNMKNTKCTITLVGKGWSGKQNYSNAAFNTKPDKKMIAQVSAMDPAYGATSLSLTICALTILDDPSKLPQNGGVYSTGAAFRHTSILDELQKHGLAFNIIKID